MTIKMPHIVKPADERNADAFIAGGTLKTPPVPAQETVAAAKRQGISRTAWLHVAASKALES
jgi:hypothetical protein